MNPHLDQCSYLTASQCEVPEDLHDSGHTVYSGVCAEALH